jgi:apocytochrome f
MRNHSLKNLIYRNIFITYICAIFFLPNKSTAFPIYAQQAYENPREANGRIVCANCHLAQNNIKIEAPTAILPNKVFETIVQVPFDGTKKQILGNGKKGELNVGAVVILPEGFKLAPKNKLDDQLKLKTKGVFISPYSTTKENILVVGPIAQQTHKEISFPLLSPDPKNDKKVFFAKYPIYIGANHGRAQINPNGQKTNNNIIVAEASGKIQTIKEKEDNIELTILSGQDSIYTQSIPKGIKLLAKENQIIKKDDALTENPNVGGFGQAETEFVLQDPARIYSYFAFCLSIIITQAIFVFKKKQFEKVQIAELDY